MIVLTDELVLKYDRLVKSIARKYACRVPSIGYDEFYGEGMLGLTIAAKNYEPEGKDKDKEFKEFVISWVNSVCNRFGNAKKEGRAGLTVRHRIMTAEKAMGKMLHETNVDEFVAFLNGRYQQRTSPKNVRTVLKERSRRINSIDATIGNSGDSDVTGHDVTSDVNSVTPEKQLIGQELSQLIEIAVDSLCLSLNKEKNESFKQMIRLMLSEDKPSSEEMDAMFDCTRAWRSSQLIEAKRQIRSFLVRKGY